MGTLKETLKAREAWHKAVLGQEDWRSDFEAKMDARGYGEDIKAFMGYGIGYLSALSEGMKLDQMKQAGKIDENTANLRIANLVQRQREIKSQINPKYKNLFNEVFGKEYKAWAYKIENEGLTEVPMEQVQENVCNRMDAFIQRAKAAQRQQQVGR